MTGTPQQHDPQDGAPQQHDPQDGKAQDGAPQDGASPQEPGQPVTGPGATPPVAQDAVWAVAAPTSSRRRSRTQLALLATGALVVGAALGAIGGASARTSAVDEAAEEGEATEDQSLIEPGISSSDVTMSSWWGSGAERRTFTGAGLSQDGAAAHVWAFDAATAIDLAAVTRAAGALGVAGEPTAHWGSWVVGSTDGTGPSLSVGSDGQATLSYSDPSTWCTSGGEATVMPVEPATGELEGSSSGSVGDETGGETGDDTGEVGETPCPATGLSQDEAIDRARALLTAIGVQLGDARLSAIGSGGSIWVQADQVVDGASTGVSWSVSYVGETVQSVWGPLAPLVDLGEYPLVSPADAVARLADPRFSSSGLLMPLTVSADGATSDGVTSDGVTSDGVTSDGATADTEPSDAASPQETAAPTAAPVPSAGAPLDWGVQQVVLVSAELTLSATTLGDGAMVLLPTYVFTDADGDSWQVAAVADAGLGLD